MSVTDGQVYLERKSKYSGSLLLLSGTVAVDGSVSAAGSAPDIARQNIVAVFYTLTGKIKENEFTGKLDARHCNYEVKMRR